MTGAWPEVIKLTRGELYEKIWNTPTTKLARNFGLFDVALGKICKKNAIPKPPLGYWAKLTHGKRVARPPLPAPAENHIEVIEIKKRPPASVRRMRHSDASAKETPITVPDRLTSPHPLVKRTIEALKSAAPDDCGILRSRAGEYLNVPVARRGVGRAMRLVDTLIQALEARGSTVTVIQEDRTCVKCSMKSWKSS